MSWLFLIFAIVFEVTATMFLKKTNGFTNLTYLPPVIFGYPMAFIFFGFSLKAIEVSIAYAVWSAIGVVGTTILGILYFQESASLLKIACIILIVLGIVGLNLAET
ncbi:MAG: DMT family transporter [Chroococcales cyanobacterium]